MLEVRIGLDTWACDHPSICGEDPLVDSRILLRCIYWSDSRSPSCAKSLVWKILFHRLSSRRFYRALVDLSHRFYLAVSPLCDSIGPVGPTGEGNTSIVSGLCFVVLRVLACVHPLIRQSVKIGSPKRA